MKRYSTRLCLLVMTILIASPFAANAGRIEKGFEALSEYNYFKAKEIFEKLLDKEVVAAPYGLSYIYVTNNNPFYNLDSARKYILLTEKNYTIADSKDKQELKEIPVDSVRIQVLKSKVSRLAFDEAKGANTIASFNYFINNYDFSDELEDAVEKRNELAFERARNLNTTPGYQDFMDKYPAAEQFNEVKRRYDKALYLESTANGKIASYVNFIEKYPDNPYILDAMDMIYAISIDHNSIEEYARFIKNHPENRNVSKAWRILYALYMKDYSQERMAEFRLDYPNYPFKSELMKDFSLSFKEFYPIESNNNWGFIDEEGKVVIGPAFDWVSDFKEGLCTVSKNGKSGYIDKSGTIKIPVDYQEAESFREGFAVVQKEGKYGVINKANLVHIPFVYDELGEFYDNIAYMAIGDKYGFININNEIVVDPIYDGAGDFENGYAYVELDGKYGIIDRKGEVVVPIEYDWLEPFKNGLARVRKGEKYGIYDIFGTAITEVIYDNIGAYQNGLCLASVGDKHGYLNKKGEIQIPMDFDFELGALNWGQFKDGYAKVKVKDKFAMIDTLGKRFLPAIFEDLGNYTNSLIAVKKRGKWGYCDHNARLIIPYRYEFAWDFKNDSIARVRKDDKMGYINLDGNEMVYIVYDDISAFNNGRAVAVKDALYGLVDKKNNVIIPFELDDLKYVKNLLLGTSDELMHYFQPKSGELIWQEVR